MPKARGFQMLVDEPIHTWALYAAPPLFFMNHGSHALGIARAAVSTAAEIMMSRRGWGNVPLHEMPRMQMGIAEATAMVESARSYLYEAGRELWAATSNGVQDATRLRSRLRLAASHAAKASVQAVDLVHSALATSAIFQEQPTRAPVPRYPHCRGARHDRAAHLRVGRTYRAWP